MEIKAYARYFSDPNDSAIGYRTNTILQIGNSWEVIGAAFLINPGSAAPLSNTLASDTLNHLIEITGEQNDWFQFSVDATMRWLVNIFSGGYLGTPKELNGVIMLFNLFNLRNQDLDMALKQLGCHNHPYIFTTRKDIEAISGVDKVYLGWGRLYNQQLVAKAREIFDALDDKQKYYLNEVFERNAFTHPRGAQLWHNRSKSVSDLLTRFDCKPNE